jgi:hypothetical protein
MEICFLIIPYISNLGAFLFTNSEDSDDLPRLNFLTILSEKSYFLYITNGINAVLLINLCLFAYIVFKVFSDNSKYNEELDQYYKSKGAILSLCTLLLILLGKVFFIGILTLQILAIKCYLIDSCLIKTDIGHCIINVFGVIMVLITFLINETMLLCRFPNPKVPWSTSAGSK